METPLKVRDVLIDTCHLKCMAEMARNEICYGRVDFVVFDLIRAGLAFMDVGDTTGFGLSKAGRAFLVQHDIAVRDVSPSYSGPSVKRPKRDTIIIIGCCAAFVAVILAAYLFGSPIHRTS